MASKRVLVATWGSPVIWREVKYRVELNNVEDIECSSESTLKPLVEVLAPDKVILVVADTLFNLVHKGNIERDIPPKKGFETEFNVSSGEVSYDDVVKDVKSRIERYIREQLSLDYEVKLFTPGNENLTAGKRVIDLIIAPGVGTFPNVTVKGSIKDFHRYVLYALANLLPTDNAEVYLDITHGTNHMPILTYRALGSLLRLLAYLRNVELTVVESEPFVGTPKETLNILSVENKNLEPAPIGGTIKWNDKGKKKNVRKWNAFISSLANGFPLVFLTFYPNINDVKDYLLVRYKEFLSNITVSQPKGDQRWIIERKKALSESFKVASKLLYVLRILDSFEFKGSDESTLGEIMKIQEMLFKKIPSLNFMTRNQVESMIRAVLKYCEKNNSGADEWCVLGSLMRYKVRSKNEIVPNFVRNFIAHSGFESNITLVKRTDCTIRFKYGDKEAAIEAAIRAHAMKLGEGNEAIKLNYDPTRYICPRKDKKT